MFTSFLLYSLILAQLGLGVVGVIVDLPKGKILGRQDVTVANKTFYAFEKIPYAAPPIGSLRFKAPQPPVAWKGVFEDAPSEVACFQIDYAMPYPQSEDCLYLNVFTPKLPKNGENASLPTMVFIHGGAFIQGTSYFYPPDWFVSEDVILVTLNYRLGVFGFLSTGDDVIPGNNGLKDQQLAIKWTHDNIHIFGGDPEKITIFGQSAGSGSVAFQLLNQNANSRLFRSAILESGTSINGWALQRTPRDKAFALGSILNSTFLTNDDSKLLLEVLQGVDAKVLNTAAETFYNTIARPWDFDLATGQVYGPVIEVKNPTAFITKQMYKLLKAGNVLPVPSLVGMTSEEDLIYNSDPIVLKEAMELLDQHLDWLVPEGMHVTDLKLGTELGRKIREAYTEGEPFAEHLGDAVRFSSDTVFTRSIIKYAELFSKVAKTYFYQFSYHGKLGQALLGLNDIQYDGAESVAHAEEVAYLFCSESGCDLSTYPETDRITHERLIKLWTNFAKYQNPTPEVSELFQNITWPEVNTEHGDFLYLDINKNLEIKNHPKEKTYSKWVEIIDSLGDEDFDTY